MSEPKASGAGSSPRQSTDEVGAGAPMSAKCRVEVIGFQTRSLWCLVLSPRACRFAQPFAGRFLCCHPERERILARTLAEKPPGSH
jgi:hypothetical protein